MESIFGADTTAKLKKIKEAQAKVGQEAAALQKASDKAQKLQLEEVGVKVDAIRFFREQKNTLDKSLAEAFAKGGIVQLTVKVQPSHADEPVEMVIDLSNTETNRDQQIQTHRGFVHVNLIGLANQQASLVENKLKSEQPVAYSEYIASAK